MAFSLILIIKVRELKQDGSLQFCIWNVFIFVTIHTKKNTDYNIELFIQKHPITVIVILNGHKSLRTGLFHLMIKAKTFTLSPFTDRLMFVLICKLGPA